MIKDLNSRIKLMISQILRLKNRRVTKRVRKREVCRLLMIPIYKPYLNSKILSYAHDALDSGWISSHGKYKKLASDMLCEVTNTKYSYLTCNGTSACHLMARAISKFHNKRRTVAVLNNCYVAAWNTFLYEDHFKLIPVEPDEQTWNMPVRKYNEDKSIRR